LQTKSSSAEVDYLVASGGRAVPIEMKSGPGGPPTPARAAAMTYAC